MTAGLLGTGPLLGQDQAPPAVSTSALPPEVPVPAQKPPGRRRFAYDPTQIDITIGVFPQLTATRSLTTHTAGRADTQNTQGATPSAGILGTFHQQFSPFVGYNINVGYTRTAENFTVGVDGRAPFGSFTRFAIGDNMYELSVASVIKGPASTRRLQTFLQGGGGLLAFLPSNKFYPGGVNFRAAALFGAGADYRLSPHFGFRVEYRGLFYKNPDFVTGNAENPTSKAFTVTSEPTIGLTYRFGAHRKMQ